ncbi:MAG: tandem-95 repeat protein [Calditrichaeota bacterium]|nr:MAG: tandem-95 repeat protein [Calditrichota bacterium]
MLTLNIENVNRAPSLPEISDLTTPENQMLSTVLPEGSDPDSEDRGNLSYTLQNMPDGASFDPASRVLEWTPSFNQSGTYNPQYSVKDLGGLSAEKQLSIIVTNVNREPSLGEAPSFELNEGEIFSQVLPEATDPDREDAGKLKYELQGQPEGANFNSSTRTFSWIPRYDQAGSYSLTYQVTDQANAAAQTTISLTVNNVNRDPRIKGVGSKSVKEGEELSFQVEAEDPDTEDQGKLSIITGSLPAGANFNSSTGTFSWIPREDQQGNYTITFSVKDGAGGEASISVNITVEDVPPPVSPEN